MQRSPLTCLFRLGADKISLTFSPLDLDPEASEVCSCTDESEFFSLVLKQVSMFMQVVNAKSCALLLVFVLFVTIVG